MSKKIQLKQGEVGQKKSGCLGAWYHEMIRLIFKSIRKRSFLKRPFWQPLFKFCPSSPQKERICHVTICRVFRRGVLCLAGLLATEVISQTYVWVENSVLKVEPDNGTRWTVRVDEQTDFANDVSNCAKLSEFILKSLNDGFRSYSNSGTQFSTYFIGVGSDSEILHRKNMGQLGYMDSINNQLTQSSIIDGGNAYTTLLGLIAGWSPNSVPNVDGIPYGVETNGIFWYARDLSDSLHNTNSVFHRQLTAQETLTNQMERFMALQLQAMTNLQYAVSPLFWGDEDDFTYDSYLRFYGNQFHGDFPQNYSYAYNLGQGLVSFDALHFPQSILDSSFLRQLDSNELLGYGDLWEGYGDQYYKFYGTKWGFDSITNLLNKPFDASDIAVVKPEVDDMIQDSTEEVQDSLPSTSEELESVPPGDYEEIQDERIDTAFLDEAKTDATSIKFSEHLFDDFKTSYNGIFNFRSSSSLQYSFSLQSSDGVNVSINDTDMLGNASSLLAEKKPTIDAFIKIIIGLNKFICLVVLVGKAFKMVSEIFSS